MMGRQVLAREAHYSIRSTVVAGTLALLSACATTHEPVNERLDPATATTLTILSRPIELYSQTTRGTANDPFAYMAPFETDQAGKRELFLWVSAPQNGGALSQPQILCNSQPLQLQPIASVPGTSALKPGTPPPPVLSELSLSQPPYEAPVPWSQQWYFHLSAEGLQCLTAAHGIALQTQVAGGAAETFTADRKNIASLDAFSRRY